VGLQPRGRERIRQEKQKRGRESTRICGAVPGAYSSPHRKAETVGPRVSNVGRGSRWGMPKARPRVGPGFGLKTTGIISTSTFEKKKCQRKVKNCSASEIRFPGEYPPGGGKEEETIQKGGVHKSPHKELEWRGRDQNRHGRAGIEEMKDRELSCPSSASP